MRTNRQTKTSARDFRLLHRLQWKNNRKKHSASFKECKGTYFVAVSAAIDWLVSGKEKGKIKKSRREEIQVSIMWWPMTPRGQSLMWLRVMLATKASMLQTLSWFKCLPRNPILKRVLNAHLEVGKPPLKLSTHLHHLKATCTALTIQKEQGQGHTQKRWRRERRGESCLKCVQRVIWGKIDTILRSFFPLTLVFLNRWKRVKSKLIRTWTLP